MTKKQPFRQRQCARMYWPNLPFTYQCPRMVAELRRADAVYCSDTCKDAAKEQRKSARQREEVNA